MTKLARSHAVLAYLKEEIKWMYRIYAMVVATGVSDNRNINVMGLMISLRYPSSESTQALPLSFQKKEAWNEAHQ